MTARPMTPEDLARELCAPLEWVEQARHLLPLPYHSRVSDMSWFVLAEDVHIWASAWENAIRSRAAA